MDPPLLAVVGSTATGKSALGIALAERLGGEVVNTDAMQLYRGMDVGTAKVPVEARRGIPHHQIDVLDVDEEASVATYQRAARRDVAGIVSRGRVPILVGGSGLYVSALVDGLDFPGTDPELRAELAARAHRLGSAALHAELAAQDPDAAAAIDPANTRRVVRALEVVRLTGRPFPARLPEGRGGRACVRVGLRADRDRLDARIADRARGMFAGGLVEEVAALLASHGTLSRTASRAVGYAQAIEVLAGRLAVDEAAESTVQATRRLARRQERWFRRKASTVWFEAGTDVGEVLAAVLPRLEP